MKKLFLYTLVFVLATAGRISAQDTLPKFSLINAGNNRIIIGWVNKLDNVKQISIQRSFDSLTGYKTILTVADPTSPQNGFLDARAPNEHMFYRIYILQEKGKYLFSQAKKPVKDTLRIAKTLQPARNNNGNTVTFDTIEIDNPVIISLNGFPGIDSVASPVPVVTKNKSNSFMSSLYVYTCSDGNVCIRLPDKEKSKKYSIKFFEDEIQLFELKEIKEREFKIDKANFFHAGWFRFEIFEDGKVLEKHKFYLEKDF